METLLDPQAVREDVARRDRERLQGTWNFVSGPRQAQLLVAGDHFTMHFQNGDLYLGTFTLDPTSHPKAMEMMITEGPERHRGKTALCIYEMDGDHLIWCSSQPGSGERLRAFPPDEDTSHLCLIFHRDKRRTDLRR